MNFTLIFGSVGAPAVVPDPSAVPALVKSEPKPIEDRLRAAESLADVVAVGVAVAVSDGVGASVGASVTTSVAGGSFPLRIASRPFKYEGIPSPSELI